MAHVDYFLSTVSPWCYLAGRRLEEIAARHGATIGYRPVDLPSLFDRTGGLRLAERHESRRAWRLQDLRRQAAKAGLPIELAPPAVNPAPAAYAIISAQRAGHAVGPLVHAFLAAYWAGGRDTADPEVIADILQAQGLDPALADRGMLASAETYAANLEEAVSRGVFGTPFYVVGEEKFWGQDRLEDLDLHLAGRL